MLLWQTDSASAPAPSSALEVIPQLELSTQNAWRSTRTSYGWCTAEQM